MTYILGNYVFTQPGGSLSYNAVRFDTHDKQLKWEAKHPKHKLVTSVVCTDKE